MEKRTPEQVLDEKAGFYRESAEDRGQRQLVEEQRALELFNADPSFADYKPFQENHILDREEILELAEKCMHFCETATGVRLLPYQRAFGLRIIQSLLLEDGEEIAALFSRQSGKCLHPDTKVLLHSGQIKAAKDVVIGDMLMGPDSQPRKVTSTCTGREEMFEISPRNKYHEPYIVNKSHIMTVYSRYRKDLIDKPLTDLLRLRSGQESYSGCKVAVDYPHTPLPCDPYWLGLWLGDGNSRGVSITTSDDEIVAYLEDYAKSLRMQCSEYAERGECSSYAITNGRQNGGRDKNPLLEALRSLNLPKNKHIPQELQINDRETRLQFLAGIVDTDGYKSDEPGKQNTCEIVTKYADLAEGLVRLCRGLGFRASSREKIVNDTPYYRVMLYGELWKIPTKVRRRQWEERQLRENPCTYGFDIIPKGVGDYAGFTLDGNGRFLLADHTVTHNTEAVAVVNCGLSVILPTLANSELGEDSRIGKFKDGLWVGIFAPSYPIGSIMYKRMSDRMKGKKMAEVLNDPDVEAQLGEGSKVMCVSNGSYTDVVSAAPQTRIEGRTYHLIIIEEAQDVSTYKIRKCLSKDTDIYTSFGIKNYSDFVSGERPALPQVTREGKYLLQTEYEFHDNGEQEVYRIELANGRFLEATENHRWLVRTRDRYDRKVWQTQTKDLDVGFTVPVPEYWFVKEMGSGTWEEGFLIGAMLGDGCMTGDSPKMCGTAGMYDLFNDLSSEYNCHARLDNIHTSGLYEFSIVRNDGFYNLFKKMLTDRGVWGFKGCDKHIPNDFFTESVSFKQGLITGLLETDGSVVLGQKPHLDFSNTSQNLVNSFRDIVWQFGIHGTTHERENNGSYSDAPKNIYSFRIKGNFDIRVFSRHFKLKDKQASLDVLLSSLPTSVRHGKGYNVPDNMRFVRIRSITKIGKKETFCFTVPNETFFANGILSLNSIHPMAAATSGTLVKIGTPSTQKGDFYDVCARGKATQYELEKDELPTYFEYDWEHAARYNPRYKRFVEKEIERLGYDSDEFKMSYRLYWLVVRGLFVTTEILDNCGIRKRDTLRHTVGKRPNFVKYKFTRSDYVVNSERTTENQVAALDIGRQDDSTVLTVAKVFWDNPQNHAGEKRYFVHVENWLEIWGDDHETQYPQIKDFILNYNIGSLIVDATGRGDPIYDRLRYDLEEYGIEVFPFLFTSQSKHRGYSLFHQELTHQRFTYPCGENVRKLKKWQKWTRQMSDLEKTWKGKMMVVQAPDQKGDNRHDDYPDSAMMLNWLVNGDMSREVEMGSNVIVGKNAIQDEMRRYRGTNINGRHSIGRGRNKWNGR